MSVTATRYDRVNLHFADGTAVLDDAHLKVLLVTSGYVFDADAHEYLTDITGEVAGTNYVAGGVACTGVSASYDSGTHVTTVTCDPPTYTDVTIAEVAGAVFYCDTGTAGTSPLVCFWEISPADAPAAADYVLDIDPAGFFTLS